MTTFIERSKYVFFDDYFNTVLKIPVTQENFSNELREKYLLNALQNKDTNINEIKDELFKSNNFLGMEYLIKYLKKFSNKNTEYQFILEPEQEKFLLMKDQVVKLIKVPVHSGTSMEPIWEKNLVDALERKIISWQDIMTVIIDKRVAYLGGRWLYIRLEEFKDKYKVKLNLLKK